MAKQARRSLFARLASLGAMVSALTAGVLPVLVHAQDGGRHVGGNRGGGQRGPGGGGNWQGGAPVYQNRVPDVPRSAAPSTSSQRPIGTVPQGAPTPVRKPQWLGRDGRSYRFQGVPGRAPGGRDASARVIANGAPGGRDTTNVSFSNRNARPRQWTDAQRDAGRYAVNRSNGVASQVPDRTTWRTDRDPERDRLDQGGYNSGGRRSDWRADDRRRNNGVNVWRNNRNEAWRDSGVNGERNWDRNWRSNNRYDWSSYRSHNRDIFSSGRYYAPYRNYDYRRVGIGFSLGSLFYGSQYWITDPYYYRLPEVYGPYRWVRYYDDVLLVDIYTGEVVDAIYDFYY